MTKLLWRSRDARANGVNQSKIIRHDVFLKRIQKSLYCSGGGNDLSAMPTISKPFADYAAEVFSQPHRGYTLNRLQSVAISRLNANPCSLILAMIYLERLQDADPMYAKRISPTELFLVSMMISTKFYSGYDEETMYANEWAKQGNITPERIKQLELEFLGAVNWNIYVSNQVFFEKLQSIEMILAKRQGLQRGWLTYTELANLIPSLAIAKSFLQFNALFTVSYAASVVTIAGAFFLASQVPGTALYNSAKSSASTSSKLSESINGDVAVNQSELSKRLIINDNHCNSMINNNNRLNADMEEKCLDEQFQRLHELDDDDDESPAISQFNNRTALDSILPSVILSIPKINLRYSDINFGINLRSFLDNTDDSDPSPNLTNPDDLMLQINNQQNYWYENKYDFLLFWMSSWS